MNRTKVTWIGSTSLSVVMLFCGFGSVMAQPLAITPIGKFDFNNAAPEGMSGITYAGGNQYYAVEDSGVRLHSLTIDVNLATGAIESATVDSTVVLGGIDLEGVAYNSSAGSIYVSDEVGPGIREYNLSGGQIGTITVPAVFRSMRTNLSLESLSLQAGHQSLWTTSEQALNGDGVSSTSSGKNTVVRLQKFDSNLIPAGQWAYESGSPPGSFSGEQVGIVDMLVLPNGKVLVMERRVDAFIDGLAPSLRYDNLIYEVDFTDATDISNIAHLDGARYTPVGKTELWKSEPFSGGRRNDFEGITLGPQLDNGDYSVLLISDGDDISTTLGTFGVGESLYALRLSGDIGEPDNARGIADRARPIPLVRRILARVARSRFGRARPFSRRGSDTSETPNSK